MLTLRMLSLTAIDVMFSQTVIDVPSLLTLTQVLTITLTLTPVLTRTLTPVLTQINLKTEQNLAYPKGP